MDIAAAKEILDLDRLREISLRAPALVEKEIVVVDHVSMWAKPGRYFNVHYEATCKDGTTVALSAFVLPEGQARRQADRYRGQALLASPTILILPFPIDYRLRILPDCLRCKTVARHAAGVIRPTKAKVMAYRPGKRCQIRYRDRVGNSLFGKVSYETTPGQVFRQLCMARDAVLRAKRHLRLPKALAYIEKLSLTLIEGLEGENLYDAVRNRANVEPQVVEVARALAELHQADRSKIERYFKPGEELELVRSWVGMTGRLFPELVGDFAAGMDLLERDLPEASTRPQAVIHRDFYDQQVLLSDGPPSMLDVDTLCLGDPELDLGNFLAHTRLRKIQFSKDDRFERIGDTFLRSYPLPIDQRLLSWYTRSALLRLSCVYAVRPKWHWIAPALLNCESEFQRTA